ncbi:MAG: tetratricopeptide repeat protein [Planctomycetota bacterium]
MIRSRRATAAGAAWAALLAFACGGSSSDGGSAPGVETNAGSGVSSVAGPKIPTIDTSEMEPLVQDYLDVRLDAVRKRPGDGSAWAELGLALDAHMFLEKAEASLEVALDIDSAHRRAAYDYAVLGTLLPRDASDVTARFVRATEMMPGYAPGFARLGQHLLANDEAEAAADAFRRSLEVAADYEYAQLGLARALLDQDDVEGAIERLNPLHRDHPGDEAVAAAYAQALTLDGRIDEATAVTERQREVPTTKLQLRDTLRREIMSMSRTAAMNYQRGESKFRSGDLRGAAVEFERVLTVDDTNRRARMMLARTLVSLRKLDDARAQLGVLLEQEARDPSAHALLGQLDAEARRFEDAIAHFGAASSGGPLDDVSTEAWISVLGDLKRWDEALYRIEEWVQRSPTNPRPPYFRAMALANAGRVDEARQQLAGAIAAHPQAPIRAQVERMFRGGR